MSALPLLVSDPAKSEATLRRKADTRRRLDFEFFDQLDWSDGFVELTNQPNQGGEGAD